MRFSLNPFRRACSPLESKKAMVLRYKVLSVIPLFRVSPAGAVTLDRQDPRHAASWWVCWRSKAQPATARQCHSTGSHWSERPGAINQTARGGWPDMQLCFTRQCSRRGREASGPQTDCAREAGGKGANRTRSRSACCAQQRRKGQEREMDSPEYWRKKESHVMLSFLRK